MTRGQPIQIMGMLTRLVMVSAGHRTLELRSCVCWRLGCPFDVGKWVKSRVAPGCGESSTQHELFNSSKRWCLRLSNYIIKLYYISILVVVLYEFGNTFLGKAWWPELCNVESFTCGDTSHVWRSLVFRVLQWF